MKNIQLRNKIKKLSKNERTRDDYLNSLSLECLKKIRIFVNYILDNIEIPPHNRQIQEIKIKKFIERGLARDEIARFIIKIQREVTESIIMFRPIEEKNNTLADFINTRKPSYIRVVEYIQFKTTDKDKYRKFLKKIEREIYHKKQKTEGTKRRTLVTKEEKNFYYNGKLIGLNKRTIYRKILDCLFENYDPTNRSCSYKTINDHLEKNGEVMITDEKKIRIRILNGRKNLFRFAKNLKNETLDGDELIEVQSGKGLIFNNQVLN